MPLLKCNSKSYYFIYNKLKTVDNSFRHYLNVIQQLIITIQIKNIKYTKVIQRLIT